MTVSPALHKLRDLAQVASPVQLGLRRLSGRLGIIRRWLPFQSTPLQQRLDVGVAPHKILEQTQCISRTTATE